MEVRIAASDLEVCYDRNIAIQQLSFDVSGRVIGLIGPNGAGKSTLMKTLLGLLVPRHGFIAATQQGATLRPVGDMAFCPENGAVFADIPVRSYLELWCTLTLGDRNYFRTDGAEIVERMEVSPLIDRFGRELSKGQRRRVQIAVALLARPKLVLLDEPFDGLDTEQSAHLEGVIREFPAAFFISSHRLEVLQRLTDAFVALGGYSQSAGVRQPTRL